ncbi:MAG: GNAT family N-acetyltransferase, partial [Myxococcota bacterium]
PAATPRLSQPAPGVRKAAKTAAHGDSIRSWSEPLCAPPRHDGTLSPMLTVRTLRPDEADIAADLTARTFADPDEREDMRRLLQAAYADCPFMRPENCLVGEVDGKLVAKWQLLNFDMRVAGTIVPMCGVQGVAAEPDENHKGYARKIAEDHLGRLADLGFDFALGFAQRGALYLRMGAVPVTGDYTLTVDAYKIPKLAPDPFREFDETRDVPALIQHYNQANADATGPLIRSESLWPWLVRKPPAIHICDDGYLGVRYDKEFIEIREVVGSGSDFYEAALRKLALLARERDQRRIHGPLPPDHPMTAAAIHYGADSSATFSKKSGCLALPLAPLRLMGRLRDAMELRLQNSRYHDTRTELQFECDDKVEGMELNPAGSQTRRLQVPLSAGGLLQLAFGYRSLESVVQEEWRPEQRRSWNPEDMDLLRTLLPQGHPFMGHPDRY